MLQKIKQSSLSTRIVVGSILGLILGFVLGPHAANFEFLGEIFLRLVKMCVPLLIFCSIVESTASLPLEELGKIGSKTLIVFAVTTALAAALTIAAVMVFPPNVTMDVGTAAAEYEGYLPSGNVMDTLVNFIPENALKALTDGIIVQIIVFASLFGISINMLKRQFKGVEMLYDLVLGLRKVIMKIVTMIMGFAPIGIAAMLAGIVGTSGVSALASLGQVLLMVTVLDIIFFVGYTLYISVRYKLSLKMLLKNCSDIMLIAVTTGSSAMALPVSLEQVPQKLGVKEKISNFVLPLGNAINTNGAPISNIVSAVACASMFGMEFTTQNYILLGVYAFISAFGNPGVPGGGIVSLAIVFQMIGVPMEGVAIFAGLDYFFSITRVIVNVMGNVYSSIIVGNQTKQFNREVFYEPIEKKTAPQTKTV